jgi:uncharacterized repeat protein (TIGR01451 family)
MYRLTLNLQNDKERTPGTHHEFVTLCCLGHSGFSLSSASAGTYDSNYYDEIQIAGSALYTDFGTAYDPEAGALLGTFYSSGSTVAGGPVFTDTTLGKVFILDSATTSTYQIQVFNPSTYALVSSSTIPVNAVFSSTGSGFNYPNRLTRWGANGLAFRTSAGLFSLRSNLVQDLSTTSADVSVAIQPPASAVTGTNATFVATVTNSGPSTATNIAFSGTISSNLMLVSATPSTGTCTVTSPINCNLGSLASGSSATVSFVVLPTSAATVTLTVQATAPQNDPAPANNAAASSVTATGSAYAAAPTLTAISPSGIEAGSTTTTITVTGTNFTSSSTVELGSTALSTSFTNSTTLIAIVPAAQIASLGWYPVTVSTPSPGGGVSSALPLTIYSVLTIGVNHILYEPYSRQIYASVGSGSATVNGNTIAAITPLTGTIGAPVFVGSQPTKMAISDDGNIMYVILAGAASVARFNLQTQATQFTCAPVNSSVYGTSTGGFRDIAVQTGSENTIALDFGYTGGMALIDVNPTTQTAAIRGAGTGIYTGSSLQFYNAQTLLLFNIDTWQTLDNYPITSSGFSYSATHTSSTLLHFGLFQLRGKVAYSVNGGVADASTTPATQLGYFAPLMQTGPTQQVAPDTSLGETFFLSSTINSTNYYGSPNGIVAYNQTTFMPTSTLNLNMSTIEGTTSFTGVDLIRWGQDGLAALTSTGHIYLLRGGFVVPQELTQNTAAVLTSSNVSSITHGAGNTLITLTGSNFVPGVAVTWNGSYRTTTIISPTQVTVAIPASDLAAVGSGSLVATNPGASASSTLTIPIN